MVLIIGGAYQGKRKFAASRFGIAETALLDGASCRPEEALCAKGIFRYQLLIRQLLHAGTDVLEWTKMLLRQDPDRIILMDEIGCGIIPMTAEERLWRETVGRCGCLLAENASTVIRLFCGIPTVLKGELP